MEQPCLPGIPDGRKETSKEIKEFFELCELECPEELGFLAETVIGDLIALRHSYYSGQLESVIRGIT